MITVSLRKRLIGATFLTAAALLAGCESKEQKSIRFADSGLAYVADGDLNSAKLEFNNSLFQNRENVVALRGAARIAGEQENFQRQGRMYLRLLELLPEDIEANTEFSQLSLRTGEPERAKKHAETVLAQEPNNIAALTVLGASLVMLDKPEESAEVLQRALTVDPKNPEIFNLIAAQAIRDQDYDKAVAILDDGIRIVDNPETLLVIKLVMAEQFYNGEGVTDIFDQLITAAPENGIYRQKLADYVLIKEQNYSRARALYADAIDLVEDPTVILTRIVAIDKAEKGNEVGESTLKGFLQKYPENIELKFSLPSYYCQSLNFDPCKAAYSALAEDESLSGDNKVRALNGVADVAILQREFDLASSIADQILETDANNAPALVTRGQVLLAGDQPQDAILALRAALEAQPENPEALVYLALAYEASDQKNFADSQFARALDIVGYSKPIVDQYRAFLIRNGEFDRSIEVLDRYLRANPNDTNAIMQRAQGAIAQGKFLEAEASARQLVSQDSFNIQAGSILAQSLFSQDRFADALPITEEILAENPNDAGNKVLRAGILQRLGRSDEAIAELRVLVQSDSADALDFALLGDLLNGKNSHADARRVSVQGLTKFPEAEQLFVLGFIAESQMGNTAGATALLRDGIGKASTNAQLRTLLSNEMINAGRTDEAVSLLKSLEADDALSPLTANNLASLLLDKNDPAMDEEALRVARLLEGSDNPYFADTLAWAYFKAGQNQNAIRYIRQAIVGLPDNADVLYHKGMIDLANGDTESARTSLEKAKTKRVRTTQTPVSAIDDALASL